MNDAAKSGDAPVRLPVQEHSAQPAANPAENGELVQQRRVEYNRLVRQARLAGMILESVNFKIHPEVLGINKSLLARSITPRTKVMASGIADGTLVANIIWEAKFKFERRILMKCTASYIVSYSNVKDCSEEAVGVFVEHVGKVATYAYFRALYGQLDWAATLGSDPLPILQLQPKL